jgi:1-acyl-sn-glycerol-3-phosphate acyltransferase
MEAKALRSLGLDRFVGLGPDEVRALIPAWLAAFVAGDTAALSAIRVAEVVAQLDDVHLMATMERLTTTGDGYGFFEVDPAARKITRAYMDSFSAGSTIFGLDRLSAAAAAGPVLIVCNHLAYCDTVLKDMVIAQAGAEHLADRLIAVAGPKVYETPFRRMASLSIGTIKTAQSTAITHDEGALSPREVAEIAVRSVLTAHEQMRSGGLVVLYGEGSRSRDQRFGPFIKATRKYAKFPGCQVMPLALSGTDRLMPIAQPQMHLGTAEVRVGEVILVDDLGPTRAIEAAWHQIANMLPKDHSPAEGVGPWRTGGGVYSLV